MNKSDGPMIELGSLEGQNTDRRTGARAFNPDDFESIRLRRVFAYAIDVVCITVISVAATFVATILGIISFGVLTPLLVLILALIPLSYHTLLVGGPGSATLGMRFMNIRLERLAGGPPDYLIAFVHAVVFYLSIAATSSFILLVSLFNPRGRCLHDFVIDVVIRRVPLRS